MSWPFAIGFTEDHAPLFVSAEMGVILAEVGLARLGPTSLEEGQVIAEVALDQISRNITIGPVEQFITGVEAISRDITFTISESGTILAEVALDRPTRTVDIGPVEQFITGTESAARTRLSILVSESGTILAEVALDQVLRTVDLAVEQLLTGVEAASVAPKLFLTAQEVGVILAEAALAKVDRAKTLSVEQLLTGVEAASVQVNVTLPVISSCSSQDSLGLQIDWATGILTESVFISIRDDADDAEVATRNVNTSPSTGGFSETFTFLPAATYYALITPFTGDGQTGTSGIDCRTNTTVIS